MKKHSWIEKDDIMILYIYNFGIQNIPFSKQDIANKIGVSVGSLNYRVGNFKAIEGIGKATHFSKLSLQIYNLYSHIKENELRSLAFDL